MFHLSPRYTNAFVSSLQVYLCMTLVQMCETVRSTSDNEVSAVQVCPACCPQQPTCAVLYKLLRSTSPYTYSGGNTFAGMLALQVIHVFVYWNCGM